VKCLSAEELRARLAGGRAFSALLIDAAVAALDRDLVDATQRCGCAVVVVDSGRGVRDSRALGADADLPPDFDPRQLLAPEPRDPAQAIWFRLVAPIGDDPALHRAILAYASDFALLGTSTLPHGINWLIHDMQTASLDHALWLHEPFRADEWLLYTTDSPWAGHARGFNRGRIFSADGRLVASVTQEGLIRLRTPIA